MPSLKIRSRTAMLAGLAGSTMLLAGCSTASRNGEAAAAAEADGRLGVGDSAPAVPVKTAAGDTVMLSETWSGSGPVVLTFYRGGWCPYCTRALSQWEAHTDELASLGYDLVALTPESPGETAETESENDLGFVILSDDRHAAADAFGISFDLSPETAERYRGYGIDLESHNASGRWRLPHRGTYVIDGSGTIRAAWVEEDYSTWTEPEAVLEAIRAMN